MPIVTKHGIPAYKIPGTPKKGWELLEVSDVFEKENTNDSQEPFQICQWCAKQKIRYIHHVQHPVTNQELEVGCYCCGVIIGDPTFAEDKEREFKNLAKKRANFPNLKSWKTKNSKIQWIKYSGYFVVVGKRENGLFYFGFRRKYNKNMNWSKNYPTSILAKIAAFNAIYRDSTDSLTNY